MLHNTGLYGPNEAPVNMGAPVNMTPMSGHMNMAHNINNLSKIAHQTTPAPSGQYNHPDYGGYEHPPIGIPPQMASFPGYQQFPFQPNYSSQNSGHMSELPWQNGMFPMNLNVQNEHSTNMMNYAYEKRFLDGVRTPSLKEQLQSERKAPLNIPQIPNRTFNKPIGVNDFDPYQNENHNLDLSMKPMERLQIDSTRRKNIENTVKLIEDILIHSSNKPKDVPKRDTSTPPRQDHYKPKNNEKDPLNTPSDLSVSTSVIKKISVAKLPKEPEPTLPKAPVSPEPIIMRLLKQSQPPKQTDSDPLKITVKEIPKETSNKNEDPISTEDIEDKAEMDDDSSSDEDIKPTGLTDHLNMETSAEPTKRIDTIEIKIEQATWADDDYLQPFLKDSNGFQRNIATNCKIIDSYNSINEATAVAKSEIKAEGCFECPHCNLLFEHPKRFLIHTKWHTFGQTYEKRMEEAREREEKRLQRKEAKIKERDQVKQAGADASDAKVFTCKDCNMTFPGKSRLKNHRQSIHPTRVRECQICHKSLVGWLQLRKHISTHTTESGVDFQCSECPKRFKYAHSLAKHADTHLEKIHGCAECPKKFGSQKLLKMHMKTHERVLRGTTFRCSYCGKGFYEAFSLQVHERTHRNEKPFQCHICNTSYGTNSSLKRHLKVSHSTDKPFSCSVCHRNFSTESIRDRHEQRLHGNPEDFKFPCKMCDCKYLKHKDLQKHVYKVHPKSKRKKKVEVDKSDTE